MTLGTWRAAIALAVALAGITLSELVEPGHVVGAVMIAFTLAAGCIRNRVTPGKIRASTHLRIGMASGVAALIACLVLYPSWSGQMLAIACMGVVGRIVQRFVAHDGPATVPEPPADDAASPASWSAWAASANQPIARR